MSDDSEQMTAAELKVAREYLGLSGDWLAAYLGVQGRSLRRWEAGTVPVPAGVRDEIADLETETTEVVDDYIDELRTQQSPHLATYRDDPTDPAPSIGYPCSWHRAVAARVRAQVPNLRITYAPPEEWMTDGGLAVRTRIAHREEVFGGKAMYVEEAYRIGGPSPEAWRLIDRFAQMGRTIQLPAGLTTPGAVREHLLQHAVKFEQWSETNHEKQTAAEYRRRIEDASDKELWGDYTRATRTRKAGTGAIVDDSGSEDHS